MHAINEYIPVFYVDVVTYPYPNPGAWLSNFC